MCEDLLACSTLNLEIAEWFFFKKWVIIDVGLDLQFIIFYKTVQDLFDLHTL